MKQPFALQVAVVALLLLAGIACIPLPEGGMLFHRLTGCVPESRSMPVLSAPPAVETMPAAIVPAPPLPPASVSSARFVAELPFKGEADTSGSGWTPGTVDGKAAWRDNASGMIWGPRLDVSLQEFSETSLKTARERCASEYPQGSWALPTAAEFDIAKVNGLLKADDNARHRWITYMDLNGLTLPAGRGYIAVSVEKDFSVRCVGRSASAPAEGYGQTTAEITMKAMAE